MLSPGVRRELTRLGGHVPAGFVPREMVVETPLGPHAVPPSVQALLAVVWPAGQVLVCKEELAWELTLPAPTETAIAGLKDDCAWFAVGHDAGGSRLMVDLNRVPATGDPTVYRFDGEDRWYRPRPLSHLLARTKVQRPPSAKNALVHACARGDLDTARALIAKGASLGPVGAYGLTPLHMAAFTSGSPELVGLLLKAGADVNAVITGKTGPSLYHLTTTGRLYGRHLRPGETALNAAAQGLGRFFRRHVLEIMAALLDAGADPNLADMYGNTPLIRASGAAVVGHAEAVPLLLAAGADPNGMPGEQTPLYAAAFGKPATVEVLLAAGADPCASTKAAYWKASGLTPLHLAAVGGLEEVVRLLVGAAKDVDVRTAEGLTPLHFAAVGGDPSRARILLEAGADPHATTVGDTPFGLNFGPGVRTPLDVAVRCGQPAMLAVMEAFGAAS